MSASQCFRMESVLIGNIKYGPRSIVAKTAVSVPEGGDFCELFRRLSASTSTPSGTSGGKLLSPDAIKEVHIYDLNNTKERVKIASTEMCISIAKDMGYRGVEFEVHESGLISESEDHTTRASGKYSDTWCSRWNF